MDKKMDMHKNIKNFSIVRFCFPHVKSMDNRNRNYTNKIRTQQLGINSCFHLCYARLLLFRLQHTLRQALFIASDLGLRKGNGKDVGAFYTWDNLLSSHVSWQRRLNKGWNRLSDNVQDYSEASAQEGCCELSTDKHEGKISPFEVIFGHNQGRWHLPFTQNVQYHVHYNRWLEQGIVTADHSVSCQGLTLDDMQKFRLNPIWK